MGKGRGRIRLPALAPPRMRGDEDVWRSRAAALINADLFHGEEPDPLGFFPTGLSPARFAAVLSRNEEEFSLVYRENASEMLDEIADRCVSAPWRLEDVYDLGDPSGPAGRTMTMALVTSADVVARPPDARARLENWTLLTEQDQPASDRSLYRFLAVFEGEAEPTYMRCAAPADAAAHLRTEALTQRWSFAGFYDLDAPGGPERIALRLDIDAGTTDGPVRWSRLLA